MSDLVTPSNYLIKKCNCLIKKYKDKKYKEKKIDLFFQLVNTLVANNGLTPSQLQLMKELAAEIR